MCDYHASIYRSRRKLLRHWTKEERLLWAVWTRMQCRTCSGHPVHHEHLPRELDRPHPTRTGQP